MKLVVFMNVYLNSYENNVTKIKNLKGVIYPNKADIICLSGSIGSFFVFKDKIYNCRDPPFINLNLKNLN